MKDIGGLDKGILHAVERLYDHGGGINSDDASAIFNDKLSLQGFFDALGAGIIINDGDGRIHLHPKVFFGMAKTKIGVAF